MPDCDYTELIDELTGSYSIQLRLYSELKDTVQKILSKVVLARGDLSAVADLFNLKQDRLDAILRERERTREAVESWLAVKDSVPRSSRSESLDSILEKTQNMIKEFLACEVQLQKYLEHLTEKGNGAGL